MISDDLYSRLAELVDDATLAGVFDTRRPDNMSVVVPIAVFSSASDRAAEKTIDGQIAIRELRWQVSIYCEDLIAARKAKEAVILKLHGYKADSIARCQYDSAPGEIYESDIVPPEYHIPIDFMVTQ